MQSSDQRGPVCIFVLKSGMLSCQWEQSGAMGSMLYCCNVNEEH